MIQENRLRADKVLLQLSFIKPYICNLTGHRSSIKKKFPIPVVYSAIHDASTFERYQSVSSGWIHTGQQEFSRYPVSRVGPVNISERSRKQLEKLVALGRKIIGPYTLVIDLKPILLPPHKLFSGRTYFSIRLKDEQGNCSQKPIIDRALYSVGGKGVLPWIEVGYYWADVIFGDERTVPERIGIANSDTERKLFQLLGDLIPPGGHMMVPYELDDNVLSRMTFAALRKDVPMVATPIGFLLFCIGFTIPFRDWYIAEGGHEGPRKLHFEKPLTQQRAREVGEEIKAELTAFVDKYPETKDFDLVRTCKNNARKIRDLIAKNK